MSFPGTGKIWMNGTLVDWADAKIHVASHVVHYGSAVFEGARCYERDKLPANGPEEFMHQPPNPWPQELFAICEAGASSALTRYFWVGDAQNAQLERIESSGH